MIPPSWENTLNAKLSPQWNHIGSAFDVARAAGYPYVLWHDDTIHHVPLGQPVSMYSALGRPACDGSRQLTIKDLYR